MNNLDPVAALLIMKALSEEKRQNATKFCGPHDSFPVFSNGDQVKEAWDLAGKADDPAAVRACVKAFAEEHGLTHLLPMTAQKAEELPEGDDAFLLVEPLVVQKSFTVFKAWRIDDRTTVAEGWISTPTQDKQGDIAKPLSFVKALPAYFDLGAPLTSEHHMKPDPSRGRFVTYPVGHLQKAAILNDGKPVLEVVHISDPADFEYLPDSGSGWWGRALINDPMAARQVAQGNVGGFSWVGHVNKASRNPAGRYIIHEVEYIEETTIAAFPVNQDARIQHREEVS